MTEQNVFVMKEVCLQVFPSWELWEIVKYFWCDEYRLVGSTTNQIIINHHWPYINHILTIIYYDLQLAINNAAFRLGDLDHFRKIPSPYGKKTQRPKLKLPQRNLSLHPLHPPWSPCFLVLKMIGGRIPNAVFIDVNWSWTGQWNPYGKSHGNSMTSQLVLVKS